MSELSPQGGNERYGACEDEVRMYAAITPVTSYIAETLYADKVVVPILGTTRIAQIFFVW